MIINSNGIRVEKTADGCWKALDFQVPVMEKVDQLVRRCLSIQASGLGRRNFAAAKTARALEAKNRSDLDRKRRRISREAHLEVKP